MADVPATAPAAPPTVPGSIRGATLPMSVHAVWALVCGVVGLLVPLVGAAAIILGIIALRRLRTTDRERRQGTGVAIAGICTGGAGLLLTLLYSFMLLMMVPAFGQARAKVMAASSAAQLARNVVPVHRAAVEHAARTGRYPAHVAEMALGVEDAFPIQGYVTTRLDDGMPEGVVLAGAYDMARFDGSEVQRQALRAALDGLDTSAPFYQFGELWFARLEKPTDSGAIVFCWMADADSNVLVVENDNGSVTRARMRDWDRIWRRDALGREQLGLPAATPPRPEPSTTGR